MSLLFSHERSIMLQEYDISNIYLELVKTEDPMDLEIIYLIQY